jgi:hypothetical protein
MTTLFRPVGLHELALMWGSGMREFPPRSRGMCTGYPHSRTLCNLDEALSYSNQITGV